MVKCTIRYRLYRENALEKIFFGGIGIVQEKCTGLVEAHRLYVAGYHYPSDLVCGRVLSAPSGVGICEAGVQESRCVADRCGPFGHGP